MNEEMLVAAIIKQAIEDYVKYQRNPQKYTKSGRGTTEKFKYFQSANGFLFGKNKWGQLSLDVFLQCMSMDINANFIRKMINRIVEEKIWDWYWQDIYHPERRENITDRQQLFRIAEKKIQLRLKGGE